MSHRAWILAAAFVLAPAALAQPHSVSGRDLTQPLPVDPAVGVAVEEIRDGLYWATDGLYQAMFVVTDAGVVLVDAPPTFGEALASAIARVTDRPVTTLVYSHSHTDHIGAAYLYPGATVVAHEDVARVLRQAGDPRRPVPTVTFEGAYTLTVGGQTLELDYRGPNHEPGNLFVYAPAQRVLMLVDVVYPGWQPFKHLGVAENLPGFIEAHDQALAYDFDVLVAGHVDRLGTRASVEEAKAFVTDLRRAAGEALASTDFGAEAGRIGAALGASATPWAVFDGYQDAVVAKCVAAVVPTWGSRLLGTETYIGDNCWTMVENLSIVFAPAD